MNTIKKNFIGHGDGLGKGDFKYKILKILFSSKLLVWGFSVLPVNFLSKSLIFGVHLVEKNKKTIKSKLIYYWSFLKIIKRLPS